MTMTMNEIESALRELRLSGIRATLDTRIMQAQANQEPFLDTFSTILQDELDRRRSRLLERRFQQSGLDERVTLGDFDWRFNPKLPRQACFELHTLKFIAEAIESPVVVLPVFRIERRRLYWRPNAGASSARLQSRVDIPMACSVFRAN